jgi:hypothetical protein
MDATGERVEPPSITLLGLGVMGMAMAGDCSLPHRLSRFEADRDRQLTRSQRQAACGHKWARPIGRRAIIAVPEVLGIKESVTAWIWSAKSVHSGYTREYAITAAMNSSTATRGTRREMPIWTEGIIPEPVNLTRGSRPGPQACAPPANSRPGPLLALRAN